MDTNTTEPVKRSFQPIFRSVPRGKAGTSPGSTVYIGDREPTDTTFSLIQYNQNAVAVITPESVEEVILMQDPDKINWINVNGLGHEESFKRIRDFFRLDPLTIEDILNTKHRPKVEEFGHYMLVIAKIIRKKEQGSIEYEQVAFILTDRTVITFSETTSDCFDPVRERLKLGGGRLRKMGTDYLLYALLDVIVDNYFAILEHLGTRLEEFEDASMSSREATHFMAGLQGIKAELNRMRRIVWPVRDIVNSLMHTESDLMGAELDRYLRDLYENAIQAIEVLESYREAASGIQEIFFSALSNRMNEVMKVLTIISTIFIPLTFIAGVYGMNFAHMPELESAWGYPAVIAVMVSIAGGLLFFFKKKKWL
jgi:magnesium transporter